MEAILTLLPGDGIGPEIIGEARQCLEAVAERFGHRFRFVAAPIGGAAIDACGDPLPEETLRQCQASAAVLLGAVGGPAWDGLAPGHRPESGLLRLRKALDLYANLRPVKVLPALEHGSSLKPEVVRGSDLVVVRELSGGLYFGEPRFLAADHALNSMPYSQAEVTRVARVAFQLAQGRRKQLVSVDKANVLETSRLWRRVVEDLSHEYPDVSVSHAYVDSFALALVTRPCDFDVILTENLFGDILSDESAALTGTLGVLPSASLGPGVALFEPIHGSAPDLAGKDVANPIGTILSAAMLLRHSLGLEAEAVALEIAVEEVLAQEYGTPDLKCATRRIGTVELGSRIRTALHAPVGV